MLKILGDVKEILELEERPKRKEWQRKSHF